jgi:hypothetical protein
MHILLPPNSHHDVPKEQVDEARNQEAFEAGGGEAMPTQAYNGDQEDRPHPLLRSSQLGHLHLATMSRRRSQLLSADPCDFGA